MSTFFNICTLFVLLIFTFKTFALESSDRFETKILKLYDQNILVLNRGLEDGIFKRDHIRLTSSDGFIARGICVKTTMLTSHWKVYRVVRPQLISKDSIYKLRSINQSEIPQDLENFTKVDLSKYYTRFGDLDVTRGLKYQKERVAQFDLPEEASKSNLSRKDKKSKFDQFISKAFKDEELKNDISNVYLNIFASPISLQSRYNQKEIHYGARIYNIGEKYQFELHSVETQRDIKNPVTEKGYSSKSTHHDGHFQFNKLTDSFSIVSNFSYDREKIGNIYYPHAHYQVGLFGFKFHIWEKDPKDNFLELSYTPTFDQIEYDNPTGIGAETLDREGIRHFFRVKWHVDLTPTVNNKTEIHYAPFFDLDENESDSTDDNLIFQTTFSYLVSKDWYLDYMYKFSRDKLRGAVYNINPENIFQTLRLRYEFEL